MNEFLSVKEISVIWSLSERSVRNYCSKGRVEGAIFDNGSRLIPSNAKKPIRKNEMKNKNYLLTTLRKEKSNKYKGGIYHLLQIKLTYNSNHIEGSKISEEETEYIFSTNSLFIENKNYQLDDVLETINHFRCIDRVIDFANYELSEPFIKELHALLKNNTSQAREHRFNVGNYKLLKNVVGYSPTVEPKLVESKMKELLNEYNKKKHHNLEEIIEFHVKFEKIHPFSDGNGRVGRLILLKECLKNNIVPVLISDDIKHFYYRGIREWDNQKGYMIDTCKFGQDKIKEMLSYFNIPFCEDL